MSTSGTVATTRINTATLIDHSMRRCGLFAHNQTPETTELAKNSLYFLLTHYANRGINLWCVDRGVMALEALKKVYSLPPGTLDLLNTNFRRPVYPGSIDTAGAMGVISEFESETQLVMMRLISTTDQTLNLVIEVSDDGLSWSTHATLDEKVLAAGEAYWIELDHSVSTLFIRVRETVLLALDPLEVLWVSSYTDTPMYRLNRDQYAALPNKEISGSVSHQYWFDRQLTPEVSLWPVPDGDQNCVAYFCHRMVQDVGKLTQELEIPSRWFEATIWQLSLRLAFEIPGVSLERINLVTQMSEKYQFEVENEETDHAGVFLIPNIGGYNGR